MILAQVSLADGKRSGQGWLGTLGSTLENPCRAESFERGNQSISPR
jgi:hypothetical protein